jgi:RNA polymerase sigma factor (sigma-70 family)
MPIDVELERRVMELCEQHEIKRAMEALESGYGGEILSFMRAFLNGDARDAYQLWCEDVWTHLDKFRGQASLRTWCFKVARNRALTQQRTERRRQKRFVELDTRDIDGVPWQQRTTTAAFLSTNVKDEVRAIASEVLTAEEQELFALHTGLRCSDVALIDDAAIDGDMTFDEIAVFLAGDDEKLGDDEVKKRAATHRQRFKRAKKKLTDALQARCLAPLT